LPRIRTIRPEMFESEKLGRLSPLARLTFVGLIALADDEGRGRGSLVWLQGRLHPYDPKARRDLFKATNDLALAGLVRFYEAGGSVYYQIKGWKENQYVQHPKTSRLPAPPHDAPSPSADTRHDDDDTPHEPHGENHAGTGNREQGTGSKEGPQAVPSRALMKTPEAGNGGDPPKVTRFEPPSPDEVRAWAESKHPDWLRSGVFSPVKFCAFYESKGWKVGKSPMKNWRAAAVNWTITEEERRGS
jgi:hypothetical protein